MPTVRLPAPFLRYACQRSLLCCEDPVRAPCDATEQARIAAVLASSAPGRGYLPIFQSSFEEVLDEQSFKQVDGSCVHLGPPPESLESSDEAARVGCSLQFIGGVPALSIACRNYPRWVARLPADPDGSHVELEALFLMACPTAAKLLVQDPSPFRFVEVPLESWIYPATTEPDARVVSEAHALRTGWWRVLADGRDDPERLAVLLARMYADPFAPPSGEPARNDPLVPELLTARRSLDIGHILNMLGRTPENGANYAEVRWQVRHELSLDLERRALLDALDIAPEILCAYLDQLVPFAGVHDQRPLHLWMRTAVRRVLMAARLADALLARVPFGINTLLGDIMTATTLLDAMGTPRDG